MYVYPASNANFYLRGGAGLATFHIEDFDTETGFGWSVGLGYDIPIGTKTGLTPFANWSFGDINDATVNVLQVGLGIKTGTEPDWCRTLHAIRLIPPKGAPLRGAFRVTAAECDNAPITGRGHPASQASQRAKSAIA